jgi:hypothetical protein
MDLRMNRTRTSLFFLSLVLAAPVVCAQDNPPPGAAAPAPPAAKTRALKLGLCAQVFISQPFTGDTSQAGPCVIGVYEFLLSPRSALGIEAGYRQFFGADRISELVYGLVLKHYLLEPSPSAAALPYLQYGLLQRIARQRGREGAAVMYDAGLMAGTDVHLLAPLFFELAFHISHLTALGDESRNASYFEMVAGTRLTW